MLFNSLEYALFLPIVFTLYWLMPSKYRCVWLLVTSYYFYMSWNIKYVVLIFGTTIVSYTAALLLEKVQSKCSKQIILFFTAVSSLGVLFFFKYFNFFTKELSDILSVFSISVHPIVLNILLPVGISFYTFQTLSYVIDVYRGKVAAEKNFLVYATFISFFPQLVAGPIERTSNLLPQIKNVKSFNYDQSAYGLKLMTWGFFKKLVIADILALYVDKIYNNPFHYEGFSLVLAILFFTIQIYCDFSGYSDIAIGTAKLLGIDLMTNFKSPYFSTSLKEFWNRWHISLSTWFRDYLYIPLGGNRVSRCRHCFNLLLTFLVSGLWHGANTTFILWGGVHGMGLVLEQLFLSKSETGNAYVKILRNIIVFIFCALAWNFFRSNTIGESLYILNHMFSGISDFPTYIINGFKSIGIGKGKLTSLLISIAILSYFDYVSIKNDCFVKLMNYGFVIRHSIYLALIIYIMLCKASGDVAFVYFQF